MMMPRRVALAADDLFNVSVSPVWLLRAVLKAAAFTTVSIAVWSSFRAWYYHKSVRYHLVLRGTGHSNKSSPLSATFVFFYFVLSIRSGFTDIITKRGT